MYICIVQYSLEQIKNQKGMKTTTENNTAALIHLSTLTQYCIPFGNYIIPIVIWNIKKNESETIDYNGKQVLNFQLSWLLYSLLLVLIMVPVFLITIFNHVGLEAIINNHDVVLKNIDIDNNLEWITVGIVALVTFLVLKCAEFFLIMYATIKTSEGERYRYPLTLSFIK